MIKPVYDEQQYQDNNTSLISSNLGGTFNVGNSILILISPRNICDHYKRPYVYNFNNEVIEGVGRQVVAQPSLSQTTKIAMNSIPAINSAIVPAGQGGINVATSAYSNSWTFIFLVDDNGIASIGQLANSNITDRKIYMGICGQEPISQMGLASATPEKYINIECPLIVTRQMLLRKSRTMGARGYQALITSQIDNSVVQFDENLWGIGQNDNTFYPITPGDVHNHVAFDSNQFTTVTDTSNSLNVNGSQTINSSLESPRMHMRTILAAIETAAEGTSFSKRLGDWGEAELPNDAGESFQSYTHSNFAENKRLDDQQSRSHLGDIATGYLKIGMLLSAYNSRIIPIKNPQNNSYDILPQNRNTINNIFSSMVCSAIPAYLNTTNLSEVAFMYNSYNDACSVQHIGSGVSIDNNALMLNWKSFEYLLRNDLFPVLKQNGGEFDLQVMSMVNGATNVVLNFLDFEIIPFGAVYQENTNLGGITSSLVGNSSHLGSNAVRLNDLIMNVGTFAKFY